MVFIHFIIDSAQIECKRQSELHVKVGIKVFRVQHAAMCTLCSTIPGMLYLRKKNFWRRVMIYEQLARLCAKIRYHSWKIMRTNQKWSLLFRKLKSCGQQFFMHCFCCKTNGKIVGVRNRWQRGCSCSSHSCPVSCFIVSSWQLDLYLNAWTTSFHVQQVDAPFPKFLWALGSHVGQGKDGGSLGELELIFGCNSQLPLSNFRRGVQE